MERIRKEPAGSFQRFISLIAIVLSAIAVVSGCGPKSKVSFRDPTFTGATLRGEKLAVGGMTWNIDDRDNEPQMRAVLDSLLWLRLNKDMESVEVKPVSFVQNGLGEQEYTRLLTAFERNGALSDSDAAMLQRVFKDSVSYLLFGSIVQNKIEDKSTYLDNQQEMQILVRRVSADFLVFNAVNGRQVWKGRVSAWKSKGETVPEEEDIGFLDGLVSDLLFGEEPEPEKLKPPSIESVTWKLYGGLSKTLLKQ